MIMEMRVLIATVAAAGFFVAASPAPNAKPPRCPSGWEEVTEAGVADLPLFQQGIADGLFTADELQAGFHEIDDNWNGNGVLCVKNTPSRALPHPYKITDDRDPDDA